MLLTTISCGGIIWKINNNQIYILLVKQKNFKECYGIPKGHLEKNESHEDCCIREILEETNLKVTLQGKLPITAHKINSNEEKTVFAWYALCEDENDLKAHPNEIDDVQWFAIDNLPKIRNYQRELIDYAITELKKKI